jgi:hypothetical protein
LKLVQATFPENSSLRFVILTDGNETIGTAAVTAKRLTDDGIGIDIVPIRLGTSAEVLVEKIDIPGQVRQGQPIDARIVLQRYTEDASNVPVDGRLRVTRRIGGQTETIADGPVTLDQEINVIPIPHRIEQAAGYTYEAEFIPDSATSDSIPQNNRTTAFTYARGKGRVMLIENSDRRGEYDLLVEALRRSDIEVELRDTSNLFSSLIELQGYDSVILAGVSRSSSPRPRSARRWSPPRPTFRAYRASPTPAWHPQQCQEAALAAPTRPKSAPSSGRGTPKWG